MAKMPGIGPRIALRAGNFCLNIHPTTFYLFPVKFVPDVGDPPIYSFKFLCFSFDHIKWPTPATHTGRRLSRHDLMLNIEKIGGPLNEGQCIVCGSVADLDSDKFCLACVDITETILEANYFCADCLPLDRELKPFPLAKPPTGFPIVCVRCLRELPVDINQMCLECAAGGGPPLPVQEPPDPSRPKLEDKS